MTDEELAAIRERLALFVVIRPDVAAILAEVDRLRAQVDVLRERVRRVQWVHTWTNEDGKQFVFADDLVEALDGVA